MKLTIESRVGHVECVLRETEQLSLFENENFMNSTSLKYPRRKSRSIASSKFILQLPTETTSQKMQSVPSSNTKIEQILEKELISKNILYTKPEYLIEIVEGKPDFIIPKYRIAIFCDGDFWHGNAFDETKIKNNSEFWSAKIKGNILRDEEVTYRLKKADWKVFRFWEHEIKSNAEQCVNKIIDYIGEINKTIKPLFSFVDLFSGIGGFRIPLEELGGKCLGFSEIDKQAINVYKKNFLGFGKENEVELGDITKLGKLPYEDIDLIVGGVPCQAWSVAGNMKGFEDPRGKLWHDTIRIVKLNKPKAFIFENVKGLIDPRNEESLNLILDKFRQAGYSVKKPRLLNSYDFGLPQNRDRIFIVGIRNDLKRHLELFEYPKSINKNSFLGELLNISDSNNISEKKVFHPNEIFGNRIPMARNRFQKVDELNDFFIFCDTRNGHTTIHSWDIIKTSQREKEICMVILRNRRKKIYGTADGNPLKFDELKKLISDLKGSELENLVKKNILRFDEKKRYEFVNSKNSSGINDIYRIYLPDSKIFSTLTATGTKDMIALENIAGDNPIEYKQNFIELIIKQKKFRSITAKEAGRLQGFPDWFSICEDEKVAKKQFGNAVSVSVIYYLAKSLLQTNIFNK
jgi:DNA (cytosine-5)-methyltransferase 1